MACLLATSLAVNGVDAQTVSPSRQINTIKRDSQYIFAEATGKTSAEATEMANMLLEKYINEYIAANASLDIANNVVVKNVVSASQKIEVPRGSMTRVFVFVKKSNIEPAESVKTIAREERQQTGTLVSEVEEIEQNPTVVTNTAINVDERNVEVADDPSLPAWQLRVVKEIAAQPTLHDVRNKLNTFKVQNKVKRFGSLQQPCQTPDVAFYVVADANGNITAVLGQQSDSGRLNYLTGQQDQLNAHSTETLMWFTLNK